MHQILTGRENGHNTLALITVFKMYQKRELLKMFNVSIKDYQQRQFTCTKINEFYNQLKVIYMYMYLII